MKQLLAKLKAAASWTKRELLRIEVLVKGTVAASVAGGINTVASIYSSGKQFELSAAHLLEVKGKFISGAVIGLIMYLVHSPLGKAAQQPDANNAK